MLSHWQLSELCSGNPCLSSKFLTNVLSYTIPSIFIATALALLFWTADGSNMPLVNAPTALFSNEYRKLFATTLKEIMADARALYPNKTYRVRSDNGDAITILPYNYADEIRNNSHLNFSKFFQVEFQKDLPGFEVAATTDGVDHSALVRKICVGPLNRSISAIIQPISDEMSFSLSQLVGEPSDWHEFASKPLILDIVARMTSRVFLGDKICRDPNWLQLTKSFTIQLFAASAAIRRVPGPLRFICHWFVPECRELRRLQDEGHRILLPVVQERQRMKTTAQKHDQPKVVGDAIDWASDVAADRDYKPILIQLGLSVAGIHTTTNLFQQVLLDILEHPNIIPELRQEMSTVLGSQGWAKTALYNMKLLDSVIKESQRRTPPNLISMRRYVTQDVKLSDGTTLPKGSRVGIDANRMLDPAAYDEPMEWKPYRFLELRSKPATATMAQAASVHVDHTAFGYGHQACPGRSFAVNEIKIALCHLVLKYDLRLAPGSDTSTKYIGAGAFTSADAKIMMRKRSDMELDIDSIGICI